MWNLGQFREKSYLNFPSKFCVFTVKSPSVTKRSVKKESAFKKSKNPSAFFFSQNYRLNSFFYSSWKQFQVVEIAKFWIQCNSTLWPRGKNAPGCDPLSSLKLVCILLGLCCVVSPHLLYFPLPLHNDCNIAGQDSAVWIDTIIAAYNGDMYNGSEAIDYYIGLCWKWKVYFITSN